MLNDAMQFVERLTGSPDTPCTWQTFDDAGKDRSLARCLHGPIASHWDTLMGLSARGAGVFVTVAETDLAGRRAANIIRVRALFVDADNGPPAVAWHVMPDIIIDGRAGLHAYWLVDDCPLDAFPSAQKRLASYYGTDPAVHDLPRVMRLPGTINRKAGGCVPVVMR